jgi:hypothetical protein
MGKLGICAAAIALAFATVPASADHHTGPLRQGTNCWHPASGPHGGTGFGYWETCPSAAIGAAHTAAGTGSELRRPLRPRRDPHNDR